MNAPMPTGIVKFWRDAQGYGFLGRDDGQDDSFAHVHHLVGVDVLAPGQRVEFEDGVNPRNGRPEAQNIKVLKDG
jgi:cold shock protein